MVGSRFYAVRRGRQPGVYKAWFGYSIYFNVQLPPNHAFFSWTGTSARPKSKTTPAHSSRSSQAKQWRRNTSAQRTHHPLRHQPQWTSGTIKMPSKTSCTAMAHARVTVSRDRWRASACGGGRGTPGERTLSSPFWQAHRYRTRAYLALYMYRNLAERCPGAQTNNRAELYVCFPISSPPSLLHC